MKKIIVVTSVILLTIVACKKDKTTTTTNTTNPTATSKATYTTDVKTIIDTKCATANCHATGKQQPDLTNYTNCKSSVTMILQRMNLATGSPGFMPEGASKTQVDVDKITKWQSDGLTQ